MSYAVWQAAFDKVAVDGKINIPGPAGVTGARPYYARKQRRNRTAIRAHGIQKSWNSGVWRSSCVKAGKAPLTGTCNTGLLRSPVKFKCCIVIVYISVSVKHAKKGTQCNSTYFACVFRRGQYSMHALIPLGATNKKNYVIRIAILIINIIGFGSDIVVDRPYSVSIIDIKIISVS